MKRLVTAAALAVCATACNENACVDRGTSGALSGVATWSGAVSGGATTDLQIDDLDTSGGSCTADNVEFSIRAGQCFLWIQVVSFGKKTVGVVEPNQSCMLSLGDGTAVPFTTDGNGAFRAGSRVHVTLTGTVSGEAGAGGALVWDFQGS